MFKKLRNQFMALNIGMISVLILMTYTSIYYVTYQTIRSQVDEDLNRLFDMKPRESPMPRVDPGDFPEQEALDRIIKQRSISFVIETDSDYAIIRIMSFFEDENSFYSEAINAVIANKKNSGTFEMGENHWAYKWVVLPDKNVFAFIDVTPQHNVLTKMLSSFALLGALLFVVVFLISKFLAQRAIKPVEAAFERQKQFVSDASHELKTPLTIINTNIDVLKSNEGLAENKWLNYIQSEVQRMSKLTKDLLYLAQSDSDSTNEKSLIKPFHMTEMIEHRMLSFEALIFEKKIEFNYDLAPDVWVTGVRESLEQVVLILMDNAIKYTPEKGNIDVALEKNGQNILFTVSNSGEGISNEDLPYVFDRFYKADASRKHVEDSYGLGLSIAKAIVNKHGGKLTCKSIPGSLTTFQMKLK